MPEKQNVDRLETPSSQVDADAPMAGNLALSQSIVPSAPSPDSLYSELLPWLQKAMEPLLRDEAGTSQSHDLGLAGGSILNAAESTSEAQAVISGELSSASGLTKMETGSNDSPFEFEVLVVDDDPVAHLLIQRVLHKAGLSARCVLSGEAALALLDEAHALKMAPPNPNNKAGRGTTPRFPDVIILDVNFPIGYMGGRETVKEIRRRFPRSPTPVIAHTCEEHPKDLMQLLDAGFSDYVSKRSTVSDLIARICVQVKTAATHRHLSRLEKGDAILQDILPGQVVGQLLEKGHVEPEHLGEVSILFADIVGFTEMSSRLQTISMIKVLNKLFSAFDKLAIRMGVFKVETIGDCYMCVAGHDMATKKDHARLMVQMGLSMIEEAQSVVLPDGKESVSIRVGIHTGPVYAGVVGLSKPRYCLFGDTVNVASRMETTSKPGQLHVSEATYLSCFPTTSPVADTCDEAGESIACQAAGRAAEEAGDDKVDMFKRTTCFSAAEHREIKGKGLMLTRFCNRRMSLSEKKAGCNDEARRSGKDSRLAITRTDWMTGSGYKCRRRNSTC